MEPDNTALLARTAPKLRPNGERALQPNIFMQVTWVLLGVAAVSQVILLVLLDVMF
jgi:hypothetical protein